MSIVKVFSKKISIIICFSLLFFTFAQTMPKMPDFPSITQPELDGNFYKPSSDFYKGFEPIQNSSDSVKIQNEENKKAGQTEIQQNQNQDSVQKKEINNLISSYLSSTDYLTASDLNSISNAGLFSNLGILSNKNSGLQSVSNSSSDMLLSNILTSLEEIKKNQKLENPNLSSDDKIFRNRNPEILRFKINGYEIKDSLTTVYFSNLEDDGSFLLTADRNYFADGRNRTETFYILFKASSKNGKSAEYDIDVTVSQDYENVNSFIYKFGEEKNLQATKTGNLVALHKKSQDLQIDLLLDVDN